MRDTRNPASTPAPDTETPAGGFWFRWRVVCVIAALLVALPAGRQAYNWYEQSREAKTKQAARDSAKDALAKLEAEQNAVRDAARAELDKTTAAEQEITKKYRDELQKSRKLLEEKDFSVRLTGPAQHSARGAE